MKKRIMYGVIGALVTLVFGFVIYNATQPILKVSEKVNVEINETIDLQSLIEKVKNATIEDVEISGEVDTTKLGEYPITFVLNDKEYVSEVHVVDTKKPEVTTKEFSVKLNQDEFKAEDFIEEITDATNTKVSLKKEYKFEKAGDYDIEVEVVDEGNNKTTKKVTIHVEEPDKKAPVLNGLSNMSVYVNQSANYNQGVSIQDDFDEAPTYTVDSSKVNLSKVGSYEAVYETVDKYGNKATYKRVVNVVEKPKNTYVPSGDKVIYLTFDDGPSQQTPRVLEILDRYNVKASFFVIGNNKNYLNYIKVAHDKGHTICLHTNTHNYASVYASVDAYIADLKAIQAIVREQIGINVTRFRFPGGSSNHVSMDYCKGVVTQVANWANNNGYKYYDWNSSCGDGSNISTAQTIQTATTGAAKSNQMVMLLHDAGGKGTTVEALPAIIEYYQKLGYTFKAIDDQTPTCHHRIAN